MCGIIGYTGYRDVVPLLFDSLQRLEYRGYDSAGIAIANGNEVRGITVIKNNKKVGDLRNEMNGNVSGERYSGMGHTRWATHGKPTKANAHPHYDCAKNIHVIHNGIIENFHELKTELITKGHIFESDTDTEVIPHLIEEYYTGDLVAAVREALPKLSGTYALVVMSGDDPSTLIGARCDIPLVVGFGRGEHFIGSDIAALIPYTHEIGLIENGSIVTMSPTNLSVQTLDGEEGEIKTMVVDWSVEQAQRGGYPHFMLKEIYEQPDTIRHALQGRVSHTNTVSMEELVQWDTAFKDFSSVYIVACGTALYAGMVMKYAMEKLARIHADTMPSSEFRYGDPVIDSKSIVIAISQSGETADTLAAVRQAQKVGAYVLAITNFSGSTLAQEADDVMLMNAGPEISVASTKCFVAQVVCGILLALHMGRLTGRLTLHAEQEYVTNLLAMPELVAQVLPCDARMKELAFRYSHMSSALYVGRGINFPIALEGALKLKEVSYVHAEGYPAGELKHGPIALLDHEVPVIAIATQSKTMLKLASNVQEALSRDAPIIALVTEGKNPFEHGHVEVVELPVCDELLSPIMNVIPLQLFAYHVAVARGCNVDQPRNLAKSVTVE